MKILIATFGTRGDVEPFVHLSRAASDRGHSVTVLATEEFRGSFGTGIEHVALPGSVRKLIEQTHASPLAASRIFASVIKPLMVAGMGVLYDVANRVRPDVIIYHPKIVAAPLVAATVGAVAIQTEFAPITVPTSEFASAGFGTYSLGFLNRATYALVNFGSRQIFAKELDALRKKWGVTQAPTSTIVAVSPSLVSRPDDYPANAWISGQWIHSNQKPSPDDNIATFCEQPTIVVTFGSMVPPRGTIAAIIAGARSLGLRTLLIGGWSGLELSVISDADVMAVDEIAHDAVFPLCELVVHHGGAGTTHAAARAGVPQWIIPVLADQPWWKAATLIRGIGIGAKAPKAISADAAAAVIAKRSTASVNAKNLGVAIAREDGCANALDIVESLVAAV